MCVFFFEGTNARNLNAREKEKEQSIYQNNLCDEKNDDDDYKIRHNFAINKYGSDIRSRSFIIIIIICKMSLI